MSKFLIKRNNFYIKYNTEIKSSIIIAGFGFGIMYLYQVKEFLKLTKHPTKKAVELILLQDKRVTNKCGFDFETVNLNRVYTTNNKDTYIYWMEIRPSSLTKNNKNINYETYKVLVKCDKNTHADYKIISDMQIKYSKMTNKAKINDNFTPINFNDVFIINQESLVKSKHKDIINKLGLFRDKDESTAITLYELCHGLIYGINTLSNKKLNHPIDDSIELWRISNLLFYESATKVICLRPFVNSLTSSNSDFSPEDTYYTLNNYYDILQRLKKLNLGYIEDRSEYDKIKNKLIKEEEERQEKYKEKLVAYRKKKLKLFSQFDFSAKFFFTTNIIFLFMLLFYKKLNHKSVILNISKLVEENQNIKNWLGNIEIPFVYYSYARNPITNLKWRLFFNIPNYYKVYIYGTKVNCEVDCYLEYNNKKNSYYLARAVFKGHDNEQVVINYKK